MIVCICNNLTRKALALQAAKSSCYDEFMNRTNNAGKLCGKCSIEVKNLYNNYNEN